MEAVDTTGWKTYNLKDSGWVSVKDRLPDTQHGPVLVYDGIEMFEARFFSGLNSLPYFYSQDTGHLPDVTHWMPLPEKPPRPSAL
jgi:hypothetical protein